jgi:hypothetical protein
MSIALAIIYEVETSGVALGLEGNELRLVRGKTLPPPLLDKIKTHKSEIVDLLDRDRKARDAGFLPLCSGEVYERQIQEHSHVFVMKNEDGWTASRESWKKGRVRSVSTQEFLRKGSFDLALMKAKQYVDFMCSPDSRKFFFNKKQQTIVYDKK